MMVNLIKPKIFNNGKIETIFGPSMGTGCFLITYTVFFIRIYFIVLSFNGNFKSFRYIL